MTHPQCLVSEYEKEDHRSDVYGRGGNVERLMDMGGDRDRLSGGGGGSRGGYMDNYHGNSDRGSFRGRGTRGGQPWGRGGRPQYDDYRNPPSRYDEYPSRGDSRRNYDMPPRRVSVFICPACSKSVFK